MGHISESVDEFHIPNLQKLGIANLHPLKQVAPKFFDKRNAKKQGVDGDHVDYTNQSHPV